MSIIYISIYHDIYIMIHIIYISISYPLFINFSFRTFFELSCFATILFSLILFFFWFLENILNYFFPFTICVYWWINWTLTMILNVHRICWVVFNLGGLVDGLFSPILIVIVLTLDTTVVCCPLLKLTRKNEPEGKNKKLERKLNCVLKIWWI